ncbi:hypothetical protein B0A48_18354 [Cryoendolithus antarcticus]|uniref:Uncharacterized protein n=1 Tax=Cryoendolithus antarcticus TaxID=1507870 RepID=A0A1V8SA67_9PEZI|nr:hypothetical protein B0A48_18354 [Cryoendolithus antarcticus]
MPKKSVLAKLVYRYLLDKIGRLLMHYLWLAAPCIEQVHILAGGTDAGSAIWKWEAQPEEQWRPGEDEEEPEAAKEIE